MESDDKRLMVGLIGPLLVSILFSVSSFAQEDCDTLCGSQLLRVDIAANALNSSNVQSLKPALQKLADSPTLQSLIAREYPLQPIGFPQSQETCLREKAEGDPDYADIDCMAPGLCSDTNLKPAVRERICFKLPCPILEGNLNAGKCQDQKDIYPTGISFPEPLNIKNIKLSPTKVDFKNKVANLCFNISQLELTMSTSLTLETSKTSLPDKSIDIKNINPVLKEPREICVTANVDITSPNPVSNIKLTPQGNMPIISDDVIRDAATRLQIQGLSGYPADALSAIQSEVVPVLFQPLRDSIETGLATSLAKVFEDQIKSIVSPFTATGSAQTMIDSRSFMNELGLTNITARDQVAKLECAALKGAGRPIPGNHACVGLKNHMGETITPENFDSSVSMELSSMSYAIKGKNVTSENIKQRLLALKDLMREEKVSDFFTNGKTPEQIASLEVWHKKNIEDTIKRDLDPLVDEIAKNQLEGELYKFISISNQLNQGQNTQIGLSLPEICSDRPSPHAGKKMANCPISVYADLNEFNKVLGKMFDTGRMCMSGKGPYVPETDASGNQAYNTKGWPLSKGGCEINVAGMSCYIKQPPQIKYDTKTRKYKVDLKMKECFYPGVFLGLGKFGADFNIDFSFNPKACHNGDFCMDNPDVKWNVVPGTERFGMKQSSFFNGIITSKINDAIKGAMQDQIRLPLASSVNSPLPLQAQGRVDAGPGYFGACLEVQKGASGQ